MQRFAYRLYDLLQEIINAVDFESFRDFGTIDIDELKNLDERFSDLSPSDQMDVMDVIKEFLLVDISLGVGLTIRNPMDRSLKMLK